jgi:drug/metabolite transporter (DMT)-like permease
VLAAWLSTILFSISSVCGHRSAKMIGGTEANFWRASIALILLGIWSYAFGVGVSGPAFPLLFISGMIGIGFGDVASFQALPLLGPRVSSLLVLCMTAPLAAVVEWLWLGTRLTSIQVLWGVVILVGVGIALQTGSQPLFARRVLLKGSFFAILAALGTAVGAVLSRKAYTIVGAQSLTALDAGFQRVVGGTILAGLVLLIVKRREFRIQASAPAHLIHEASRRKWRAAWPWILANGLAGQTLGVSCMQWALESTPTAIVLSITATTPIMVMPVQYFIDGERPTGRAIIGGLVAVVGVIALMLAR